jgi:transketolase C-terminal domain/subunit
MTRWLWHFADEHGPCFGLVVADSIHAAERLVRLRLDREAIEVPTTIHLQPCDEDNFTMAKGYL